MNHYTYSYKQSIYHFIRGTLLITLFGSLSLQLLTSCIRDDLKPCPPLQAEITVKDKNYFNVDDIQLEAPKREDLAFREYIPTLCYTLRDAISGEIIESQGVFNVTNTEPTQSITFCDCLPTGKYVLTIWGGLPDGSRLTNNALTSIIHTNGMEGDDIYLAHDTLIYNPQNFHYTMEMKRVTGKLLVEILNLPTDIRTANKSVNNISERVDYSFNYKNPVSISKKDTWDPTTKIITSTILAPSTGSNESLLHLDLYSETNPTIPELTPRDVSITLKRNELTSLRYVYDEIKDDFSIYIYMNDTWEAIYDLDIE